MDDIVLKGVGGEVLLQNGGQVRLCGVSSWSVSSVDGVFDGTFWERPIRGANQAWIGSG